MVEGKKKGDSVDEGELEILEKKLDSYSLICEVNRNGKDGNFIGCPKVANKRSNKKRV